jgi:hypothetical protein
MLASTLAPYPSRVKGEGSFMRCAPAWAELDQIRRSVPKPGP